MIMEYLVAEIGKETLSRENTFTRRFTATKRYRVQGDELWPNLFS